MMVFYISKLPLMESLPQNTTSLQNVLTDLFVTIDDLAPEKRKVGRRPTLSSSECITIILLRYAYGLNNWWSVYKHISLYHKKEFPSLSTYKSFLECINRSVKIAAYILYLMLRENRKTHTGNTLLDSTPLPVCKNHRIRGHKVAKDIASRGKYSLGWYYGLKLHMASDRKGNILNCLITSAFVDDREYLKNLFKKMKGIFVADAGYLSKELERMATENGSLLLTCMRKNMKRLCEMWQLFALQSRINIESVFSHLKLREGIVTSLPRSLHGLLAHYLFCIFAYQFNKFFIS